MIIIGLGSGRTGTASLANLIGSQEGAICFHELNPTGAVFEGNPQPILNTIREFQRIIEGGDKRLLAIDYARPSSVAKYEKLQASAEVSVLGDIAFYYLRYVEDILSVNQNVRFVCIKRDRGQTVGSWLKKSSIQRWPALWVADRFKSLITRTPFYTSKNHWQEHDGRVWELDPVWDKTFPSLVASSKREAIGKYWDYYYQEAERLASDYSTHFRIFPIESLSSRRGQAAILTFIGVPAEKMILKDSFHLHRSLG